VTQVASKKVLLPTVLPSNFVTGDFSARQEVVEAYAAFLVRHKRYAEARRLLLKDLSGVKALDSLYFIPELDEADTFHSNWDMAEKLRELGLWQEAQSKYDLALKRARNADEVQRLKLVMKARMPRVLPSPAVEKLCRQADKACLRGNFQVGQALYLKALEMEPQCQESLRKLSGLALKEGKVDEACQYLDLALRLNPDNARATVEKAQLSLLSKKKEDAWKMALKALDMDACDHYVLDMAMKVMKVGVQ
jgi:tetratricopeptide (TPR) repeat protein